MAGYDIDLDFALELGTDDEHEEDEATIYLQAEESYPAAPLLESRDAEPEQNLKTPRRVQGRKENVPQPQQIQSSPPKWIYKGARCVN